MSKIKETKMQCSCGGEVTRDVREVKTNRKAKEWMDGANVVAPVMLHHSRCGGCGREARIIYSMQGDELNRKGL